MNLVNAFQKIGLTFAAIIFSCAALFYSINPAQADNPTMTNNTGKIQMAVDGFALNGKSAFHIIVWDTETGKSKTYTHNPITNKFVSADYQLPTTPLY
jgi:hypothetical protein